MLGLLLYSLTFLALNLQPTFSVGPPPNPFGLFGVCDDPPCGDLHQWDGMCATGQTQSPINLETTRATSYHALQSSPANRLGHLYGTQSLRFSKFGIQNTGHDVQITFPNQTAPVIYDPFQPNNSYTFVQAHFHWGGSNNGSEHAIDGTEYCGEMHLVHYATKYGCFENALEADHDPEALLVVGILLKMAPRSNLALAPIVRTVRQVKYYDWTLPVQTVQDSLEMASFFPRNLDFFRYHGSLTVPGCNEQVLWLVNKEPVPISLTQVRQFRQVEDYKGFKLTDNWRSLQPINSRPIQYYKVQLRRP